MASTTAPGRRTPSSRSRSRDSKEAPRAAFAVQGASESARFFGVEGLLNDGSNRRGSGASGGVDHSGRSRGSTGGIDEYSERSGIKDVSGRSNGNPFLGESGRSGSSRSGSGGSKERQRPARDASGRSGTLLEAGQDTAQGGGRTGVKPKNPFGSNNSSANSGPGNRAGPFGNDRSEESEDDDDEAGPLTPEDIEEWHEASTAGGSHSVGSRSIESLDSVGGRDGSKRNVNFGTIPTHKRADTTASAATAPAGNKQPRDKQFAGSAFTTTTTSSDDTRMMANTTGGGKKPYFNLSRAEERKQFMEMMDGNGGGEVAGQTAASRANNGNGGAGGNGGSGGDVERGGNTYHTTSPLFEAADDDHLHIRTYKPRSSADVMEKYGFDNDNNDNNDAANGGSDSGEHYASMQELLAHEKSQESMFARGYPRRRGRCGGCVHSCGGNVLGQKGTRTRKIRLLVVGILAVLCIIAVVAYIAVDQTSDKGNVSESNLKAGEEGGAPTPNGSPTRPGMVPSGPLPPAPSPPVMPVIDGGDGFDDLNLTWDFPSNSPVAAPSSNAPTASPTMVEPSPRPTFMNNNNNIPYSDPPYAQPTQSPTAPTPTTDFPTLSPESSSGVGGLPGGPPTMAPTGSETPTALASGSGIASPTAPPSEMPSAVSSSTEGSDGFNATDNGAGVNATGANGTTIDGTNVTDANAIDFNATDVNATDANDANATDVNATDANAMDANATNVEIPATMTITGANCSQNLTASDYAALTTAIEDEACDPANLAADVASCEVEEITSDDVECTAVSRRLRTLLSRHLAEDTLVVAYKVLVTAVCAFGPCDDSEVYHDVKDSFTPAAIDDIVAALNDANPGLFPPNATADVVWDDDVNATDVNATDVNATDVNATDVNATDFNATDVNATDFNATDFNATDVNATDIVAHGPNSTESNYTDASCLICPDGIATADGVRAECMAAIAAYASYQEGSDACEQGKAYRQICCPLAATNGPALSCPNTLDESAQIDPNATLYYAVVPSVPADANNGLFCARLEVENDGWIGFAISSAGKMDSSTGIIGLPAEDTVMKYDLRSYGVTPAPDTRQTLMDTSLVQENGTTKMSFTKLLVEEGDVAIKEQGTNDFLHARGGAALGYHGSANRFVLSLELVTAAMPLDTNATNSSSFNETDTSLSSMDATNFTGVNVTDVNATDVNAADVNATETNATAVDATDFNATGTSWNETEPISTNSSSIDGNATMNETISMAVNASDANGTDYNETTIDMATNGTINGTEPTSTNSSIIDGNSTDVNGTDFTESSVNTTLPTNSSGTDGNVTANETMTVDTNSSDVTGADLNGTAANVTNITRPDEAARLEALSYPYTMSISRRGRSTLARYGSSVAMSQDGSIIVVGAKDASNDEKGSTGSVYIYSVNSSDSDSLTQLQRLNGNEAKEEFGNSIALSRDGERLVVGSRSAKERRGGIQIYQRRNEESSWELMEGGDIAGEVAGGRAGWAVSISADGNVVAMGSPTGGSDGGGSVLAYKYNDGTSDWEPYGSVLEGVPAGEAAGYSIALSENGFAMAVGFPKAANPLSSASNAGKTVVYNMGDTKWQRLGQEIYGQSQADIDGSSVAMSHDGSVIAIGGKGRSLINATTGEVIAKSVGYCRIYKLEDGMWKLEHSIWGETAEERQGSSVAVSPDGSVVACGGVNGENGDDAPRSGVVRLWNLATSEESAIWPRGSDDEVEGVSFGTSIALSDDGGHVVVGAPTWSGDGNGGTFAGAIQIFRDDA